MSRLNHVPDPQCPSDDPARRQNADVVFFHIPKAAGVSIRRLLCGAFPPDAVSASFNTARMTPEVAQRLARFRVICGHIGWADAARYFASRRMFTFLREPLSRSASWYFFVRHLPCEKVIPLGEMTFTNRPEEAVSLAKQLPLDDFLKTRHPHILQNLENRMTWQLGHHADMSARDIDARVCLKRAVEHIAAFGLVGFVESLSEDCEKLSAWLGSESRIPVPWLNKTAYDTDEGLSTVSRTARSMLEELNALDVALYSSALEMWR